MPALMNQNMSPISPFVLVPPDEQTPEGWLTQFDGRPHMVPTWPLSDRMALVVVVMTGYMTPNPSETVAYVLTNRTQLNGLIDFSRELSEFVALFFTVPKTRLLPCCAGLTLDDWR